MLEPLFGELHAFEEFYCTLQLMYRVQNGYSVDKQKTLTVEKLFLSANQLLSKDLDEISNEHNPERSPRLIVISGSAGTGKTTLTQYLSKWWSGEIHGKNRLCEFEWVFILRLRDWNSKTFKENFNPAQGCFQPWSLCAWVYEIYFNGESDNYSFKEFKFLWDNEIQPKFKENKVLFILDGYDEKPYHDQLDIILKDLLIKNPSSKIITSREHALGELLLSAPSHRRLTLTGFNDEERTAYMEKFFKTLLPPTEIQNLINQLQRNPHLWANAQIPLLLEIMCGVIQEHNPKEAIFEHIQTTSQLYQKMEIALFKRAYCKASNQEESEKRKLELQRMDEKEEIAHLKEIYKQQRIQLSLVAQKSAFYEGDPILEQNLIISKKEFREILKQEGTDEQKLNEYQDILLKVGFIRVIARAGRRGEPVAYEFAHKTFHEYYWALHFVQLARENKLGKLTDELASIKTDPNYLPVIKFVTGLLEDEHQFNLIMQALDRPPGKDMLRHYHLPLLVNSTQQNWALAQRTGWAKKVTKLLQNEIKQYWDRAMAGEPLQQPAIYWAAPFHSYPYTYLEQKDEDDLFYQVDFSQPALQDSENIKLTFIGCLYFATPKAWNYVYKMLNHTDRQIRLTAINVLGRLNGGASDQQRKSSIDNIVQLLDTYDASSSCNSSDYSFPFYLVKALSLICKKVSGPEWIILYGKLLPFATHSISDISSAAIQGIAYLGIEGNIILKNEILKVLINTLTHESDSIRTKAWDAVGPFFEFLHPLQRGDLINYLLPKLCENYPGNEPSIRTAITLALAGCIDEVSELQAKAIKMALSPLLNDRNSIVQYIAHLAQEPSTRKELRKTGGETIKLMFLIEKTYFNTSKKKSLDVDEKIDNLEKKENQNNKLQSKILNLLDNITATDRFVCIPAALEMLDVFEEASTLQRKEIINALLSFVAHSNIFQFTDPRPLLSKFKDVLDNAERELIMDGLLSLVNHFDPVIKKHAVIELDQYYKDASMARFKTDIDKLFNFLIESKEPTAILNAMKNILKNIFSSRFKNEVNQLTLSTLTAFIIISCCDEHCFSALRWQPQKYIYQWIGYIGNSFFRVKLSLKEGLTLKSLTYQIINATQGNRWLFILQHVCEHKINGISSGYTIKFSNRLLQDRNTYISGTAAPCLLSSMHKRENQKQNHFVDDYDISTTCSLM